MEKKLIGPSTLTITTGYVGDELVKAITYDGLDSGLSHYHYKGKVYVGTVKFNSVLSTIKEKY